MKLISILALALGIGAVQAVTIDTVYFAQTHVQEPSHPYFYLVGNRDTFIKAHVVDPASPASPAVTAVLTLDGQTLNLPLTGPAFLPASIPNGPGVVQHSTANTFTGTIPKAWVKSGLTVSVTAGAAQVDYTSLKIGAPTKVVMTMFDVQYFADTNSNYPAGWDTELEAKWPVADLEVRRIPHVVFPELVIPPRAGVPAARVKSKADYTAQTGLGFDGEQAAALAWNGALKAAAGKSGRISLYYTNIYGVGAGGQAGGFAGVGSGTGVGILHHELGHALSLPHAGDSAAYPYKGAMHGINPPAIYNETHAGPTWAFHLPTRAYIPCTVQANNISGHPAGTYKCDPMQGGGTGFQEPGYLMNHFSDYSVFKMRSYLDGHVVLWNPALGQYAYWNQTDRDYTNVVTNNGVSFPLERDVPVIAVMASISGSNPSVNMVYPPIGPFSGGLIRLFDPTVAADRTAANSIFSPATGSDLCMRVTQGGVIKTYLLAASWEPTVDPLSGGSLKTAALNLPASGGSVTKVELLLTPDAEDVGLPANPQVLYSWPGSLAAKPTNLTATGGNNKITLAWAASSGATGYNVKRATVSGGPYTTIASPPTPGFNDTTVSNGITYHYVVSANTTLGESDNSNEDSAVAIPPPATPTGLAATPGNAVVNLTWSASAGATSYNLKRSSTSGGTYTTIQSQPGTGFADLSVINGVSYYYKVSALNGGGESADSAFAGPAMPVGPPPVPTGLTAIGGDAAVALSWTASPGATGYQVKRALVSGGPYSLVQSVAGTNFNDSPLTNGTTFYYVVTATSGNGPSLESAEAYATPSRARYWDGGTANIGTNGNGASAGGNGTWNTTFTNWDAGSAPHVAWTNGSNDTGRFGGTAGTVTLGTGITVGGLLFDTAGYTLTGNILTFGTAGTITNSGTATVASEIAGGAAASISKEGAGTLVFSGTNSYSGGTLVNAGTLQLNSAAAIGGAGRTVTAASGTTLALASTYVIDNAFLNRLVETNNAFNIAINSSSANNLDFGSGAGANLPNAVFVSTTGSGTGGTTYSGTITPGGNTYRLGTGPGIRWIIGSALTGAGNSLLVSGGPSGMLILNATPTYSGTTTVGSGMTLDFQALSLNGMGGGIGVRDISVAAGGGVRRNAPDNAFLNRLVETTDEITVMTGTTANALDFSSSAGANLPNAFLGNYASNGAKAEYNGALTPASDAYRLGSSSSSGFLGIRSILGGTQGLIVGGNRVNLVAANTFSGDTTIRTGAKLTIGNNLALQNSALDLGAAGGTFALAAGTNGSKITGETAASSPTFGGLKGSRNLMSAFTTASSNNETNLNASAVTGFTLNPGSGKTHAYSGVIADGAPDTSLTKTGPGTQILTGAHIYTGPTIVTAGTLLVNSPGSLPGGSEVTVSGGTLGGNGSIGGSVTVEAGGSLSPGASAGTLFITGELDVSSQASGTGKLRFELDAPAGPNDQIAVTGPLVIGNGALGFSDFIFTNLGGMETGTYKLITSSEIDPGESLDAADLTGQIDGLAGTLRISDDGKDLELVIGDDYAIWAALYPGADLTDPGADLDGDGLSNNNERVFGLNPTSGASSNPISVPLNATAGTFSYTRRDDALTGRTFKIWTSTDLEAWAEDTTAIQTAGTANANGIQGVAVTLSPGLLGSPRRFVQVRATE